MSGREWAGYGGIDNETLSLPGAEWQLSNTRGTGDELTSPVPGSK